MMIKIAAVFWIFGALAPALPAARPQSDADWADAYYARYREAADVAYEATPQGEQELTVYWRVDTAGPSPTLFYIHGGAWEHGSKDGELGYLLPWMQMGWNVVSVNYRLTKDAIAPAGAEDCFRALVWTQANAQKYGFDVHHLVIAGASAGGALALLAGMAPPAVFLGHEVALPKPVAIVSFSGVVDVADLVAGPHRQDFAVAWVGNQLAVARRVSPIGYIRPGLPPILSVQGDRDPVVPCEMTVKFHQALTRAGVPNSLMIIAGGGHGGYTAQQYLMIFKTLREFLAEHHCAG